MAAVMMQLFRKHKLSIGAIACWVAVVLSTSLASAQAADTRVKLGVAAGLGDRQVLVPSRSGDRTLQTGLFPALQVHLDGTALVAGRWSLGLRLAYRTSVALQASELPAAGSGKRTSLRSHHVEAGVAPGVRLSVGSVLRLFMGWGWRGLRAVTDLAIPQYMLHGPVLRPELRIALPGGSVELRLAPELQLLRGLSQELRALANTDSVGIAWAAEIELSVRLGPNVGMLIDYRESRARAGSAWGHALTDVERFGTVGVDLCW
jgi:hypothetical protein